MFLLLSGIVLTACSTLADTNWPGMTADGGTVYVSYGPGIVAFDVVEGEQLWFYPPEGPNQQVQIYAPPSVSDGKIAFGDYGASGQFWNPSITVSIYMLDESDGLDVDWIQSTSAHDRVIAQPLQVGNQLYVGTADNFLLALDVENNGREIWDEPFEAGHSIWGQAAYDEGVLFVPSLDKSVYALDADSGALIWERDVGGSISDRPVLNGELLYVSSFDKQLHALDKETGETRWTSPADAGIWGAPTVNGDAVYYVDLDGNVHAARANSGEFLWQYSIDEYVVAAPVYHNGHLYIATGGDPEVEAANRKGSLVILNADTGELEDRIETNNPIYTTPVIVQDQLVLAMQEQDSSLQLQTFDTNDPARTSTFSPEVPGE